MAASFVKKSNQLFYLRLTGDTTAVKFAAVSNAGNTYNLYIQGSDDGTVTISKPNSDGGGPYYSESANPVPSGGNLDNGRFPGTEQLYSYSGYGTREYRVTGYNQNGTEYVYDGSTGGTMCLGGSSLTWGGYAYPGDGYISNPLAVGVKVGGVWRNAGTIFIRQSGVWKEIINAYVKQGGTWRKYYQNFGNSSWINMLELTDDAIDFGVQVIPVWIWPVSTFDGDSQPNYINIDSTSNASSDIVTVPSSQSITLNVSFDLQGSNDYASMLLRRISDSAIIWSYSLSGSTSTSYSTNVTFNVTAGESYRFESTVILSLITYAGTSYARVRRDNSSGVLVYQNSANLYSD